MESGEKAPYSEEERSLIEQGTDIGARDGETISIPAGTYEFMQLPAVFTQSDLPRLLLPYATHARKAYVRIFKESILERIEQEKESGRLVCRFVCDGRNNKEVVDAVLVSVGRSPATEGLFESDVPVKLERGRIVVDDFFRTNIPGVYAVGDVTGGIQLAHVASAQAAYVVERMNGRKPSVIISMVPGGLFTPVSIIPSCIYTDPEIASVGLTEEEARRKGVPVRCGKYVMQGNGQSIITGEEEGFIKVLFAPDSDELLGAQLMCPRATDMIGELATALANGLTSTQLLYAMRAHPTFNEAISCAVEDSRKDFPV